MGRDRRLHLVRRHGGTPGEGQQDEERGEPFMQVHCTKTVSIRLGSLFLTLPTRGLTEQNFISSPTRRRLIRSPPRRGRGSRAGRSGRAAWAVFRLMTSSNLSGCFLCVGKAELDQPTTLLMEVPLERRFLRRNRRPQSNDARCSIA